MVLSETRGAARHWWRYSPFVVIAVLIFTFAAGITAAFADANPLDTTRQFVTQALQILADKTTPGADRSERLRTLLEPHFDFTEMARQALGPHWRSLNPQQRQDFVDVFKNFIESAYLDKISDYAGQQVEFVKQVPLGTGYAQVFSNVIQSGKPPIPVNYLLAQKNDDWQVYDITVENISIIQNYRNQFNRVINNDGFDKLVADLRAKQRQLGTPRAG